MSYEICRHIKTNGKRCKSPALKNEDWCFFHARFHFRYRHLRTATPTADSTLLLPTLEDRESIQVAIALVVEALATNRIDEKRAAALFRGFQLATRNVGDPTRQPGPDELAREYMPTLDGFSLAERTMNDDSELPPPPPKRKFFDTKTKA